MLPTTRDRVAGITLVALLALATAGCSAQPALSAQPTPVTLTIGTEDPPGLTTPATVQIDHFAKQVDALSHGAIKIQPVYNAATGDDPDSEPLLADMVIRGDLDLGLVATRVWDLKGVTSLQALNAPFLVNRDDLVHAVISADDLRGELLAGLPGIGVEGIDLFPEALRHPFGFEAALGGVEDYAGKIVRVPDSGASTAMFGAFGATTDGGLPNSSIQVGAESAYEFTPGGIATGNVAFGAKINALVANGDAYDALTAAQQQTLAAAAAATRKWVVDTVQTDAEAAKGFCAEGGQIEAATDAQLASLVAAGETVTAEFETDAPTKSLIDQITALKATLGPAPEPVVTCEGLMSDASAAASALNGVYTVTISKDDYRAAGEADEVEIPKNSGTWTWTFEDGRAAYDQVDTGYSDAGAGLSYTLEGDRFTLYWSHEATEWTAADVSVAPDGSLVFTNIEDGIPRLQIISEVLFGKTPWVRVGDP